MVGDRKCKCEKASHNLPVVDLWWVVPCETIRDWNEFCVKGAGQYAYVMRDCRCPITNVRWACSQETSRVCHMYICGANLVIVCTNILWYDTVSGTMCFALLSYRTSIGQPVHSSFPPARSRTWRNAHTHPQTQKSETVGWHIHSIIVSQLDDDR